jgi:Kelch motif
MIDARSRAAVAPLPDGRVLVAGGGNSAEILQLQSSEIFDLATGRFARAADMAVRRVGAAGGPLPDGRVLVAGGVADTSSLQSAEIFDLATGSFSPTGSMALARAYAAAAPLRGGRVLVAVGWAPSAIPLHSAEIFDPATGSFSPTGSMTVARAFAAAAPLPDGRVLVAGGYADASWLHSAEIFDPATGSFSPTGSMTVARQGAAAAPLPDGRVLVAGGFEPDSGWLSTAEIFDPVTRRFSRTGDMTVGRSDAAAAPLPDGRVLVAGGSDGTNLPLLRALRSAELFKPALPFKLRGKRLTVTVAVVGTLRVKGAKARRRHSARDARKPGPSLKPASARGGPGRITVKLKLTERSQRRLERTGRVRMRARLAFAPAPVSGECVTLSKPCFSRGYAITETATLKLKAKKRGEVADNRWGRHRMPARRRRSAER